MDQNSYQVDMSNRVSKLETIVGALADNITTISTDIRQLTEYNRQRMQTNWGTIFAGITLMILLVTGYVGLPLKALSDRVDRIVSVVDSESNDMIQRINNLELNQSKVDEKFIAIERKLYKKQ